MAIFDIFNKRKPVKSPQERTIRRAEKPKEPAAAAPLKPKQISGRAYMILRKPHVTEKATDLTSKNQYVFEVYPQSNKNQIKKAIEDVYGVDVEGVNIINIAKKRRRLGRIEGWSGGYKKAVVKVRKGQKIEVLPR